jgi:hypothetical protein
MCLISGNRIFVTAIGKASISLAHAGAMPLRIPASGNPPIPSNSDPSAMSASRMSDPPSNAKSPPDIGFRRAFGCLYLVFAPFGRLCFHVGSNLFGACLHP